MQHARQLQNVQFGLSSIILFVCELSFVEFHNKTQVGALCVYVWHKERKRTNLRNADQITIPN